MADLERLQDDLGFVRRSVTQSGSHRNSPAIYFLWSVLVLAGFALVDVRPAWVGLYWTIAGPLGGMLSGYLGWRHGVRLGQINRDVGSRYAWHWGAFMGATFLVILMIGRGLSFEALGPIMLVLLAFSYFLAGVHIDPPFRWIGLLTAAGYVAVLTGAAYAWSMVGVALAVAFIVSGIREARSRVVEAHSV